MEWIDAIHSEVERNPRDMEMAYTAADIVRIHREGRIAALLSLEGGHLISDSLGLLRDYYRLGVRYMTLAHFKTNNWADSATDKAVHNGLSPFGRDVVREVCSIDGTVYFTDGNNNVRCSVASTVKASCTPLPANVAWRMALRWPRTSKSCTWRTQGAPIIRVYDVSGDGSLKNGRVFAEARPRAQDG